MTAPIIPLNILMNPSMETVSAMVGLTKNQVQAMHLKYLVVEREGIEDAIIFPDWISHDTMAPFTGHGQRPFRIVSGGFVKIGVQDGVYRPRLTVEVGGESTSLSVSHRREDAEIISNLLGR
jgi:hypothetical protein